jgi:hypothetical protein
MAEKASTTAIVALCISIGTAAFSVYQWWNSQQELRISVAVNMATQYVQDPTVQLQRESLYAVLISAPDQGLPIKQEDRDRLLLLINRLEYIAQLANASRLNEKFLPHSVKCDIQLLADEIAKVPTGVLEPSTPTAEIKKFSGRLGHSPCELRPGDPPPQSN